MIKRILCWAFDHKYYVIKEFGYTARKVGCERCGKKFAMHDPTESLIEWDNEMAEMYGEPSIYAPKAGKDGA